MENQNENDSELIEFRLKINSCYSVKELNNLMIANPDKYKYCEQDYLARKSWIESVIATMPRSNKFQNGKTL